MRIVVAVQRAISEERRPDHSAAPLAAPDLSRMSLRSLRATAFRTQYSAAEPWWHGVRPAQLRGYWITRFRG
jgi:hypothetical protein